MKHVKLYNTTAAMNADLTNLETPYIAVAEDALNSPVIQGYVAQAATVKVYINTKNGLRGIDESYKTDDTDGLFIAGVHAYYNYDSGTEQEIEPEYLLELKPVDGGHITFASNQLEAECYIEVPAGSVIKYHLGSSETSHFEVKILNLEDTSLNYIYPTVGDGSEYVDLEYTVNNDVYLYLGGDFS